jgi:Ribosomal RNA large subunit methyltransferase D, RlmJ
MNNHFAELGDVWKHLALTEILRVNPPRVYWETHAGSASYELTESPSRLHGALRFLSLAPDDPDLEGCAYLEALTLMPGVYPGSATLAIRALGRSASYIFCDVDPGSVASLRDAGAGLDVRVVETDGVSAIEREVQHCGVEARNVLVHIDPFEPFERITPDSRTPVELAGWLANAGYRLVYWYGYDSVERRGWARDVIAGLAPHAQAWCGDVLMPASLVYPDRPGAWGCGVVLANGTEAERRVCECLGRGLERLSEGDVVEGNDPSRLSFKGMP